jgi:hypothetical protein
MSVAPQIQLLAAVQLIRCRVAAPKTRLKTEPNSRLAPAKANLLENHSEKSATDERGLAQI